MVQKLQSLLPTSLLEHWVVKNGINHSLKFEQLGLTPFTVMANVIDA